MKISSCLLASDISIGGGALRPLKEAPGGGRRAVDEADQRPALLPALEVGDVDALDRPRRRGRAQQLTQASQALGRIDEEDLRLDVLADQPAFLEALQR